MTTTVSPVIAPRSIGSLLRIQRLTLGIPAYVAGAVIIALILISAFAPLLAPYSPYAIDPLHTLTSPSAAHLLGADASGRDILSRLIYGGRSSLLGPTAVVALSLIFGIPAGLVAGWRGGAIDQIVSRVSDAILSFPPLLLAIVAAAVYGPGYTVAILAIAAGYVPLMVRVVRGLVLVEREKLYVASLKCHGISSLAIALRHVLPNIRRAVAAQSTVNFGYALIDLAGLAFLGLGVQPPTADWGAMLAEGRDSILVSPYETLFAAIMVAIAVVAFNVLGDALSRSEIGG